MGLSLHGEATGTESMVSDIAQLVDDALTQHGIAGLRPVAVSSSFSNLGE